MARHLRLFWLVTLAAALAACSPPNADVYPGYAEADLLAVAPSTTATLSNVAVQPGHRVAVGDLLFMTESAPEERLAEAVGARRARARAQLANLQTGRRPLELTALQQQLRQAQAAATASASALDRQAQLVRQGYVAAARLDELQANQDRDVARVRELQAQIELARQAARPAEIEAAAAEAHAADADAALADWRAAQARRTAPRAGQVFDVLFQAGEVVPAGMPVVTLLPDGALKVLFFVPLPVLPRLAVGDLVKLERPPSMDGRNMVALVSPNKPALEKYVAERKAAGKDIHAEPDIPDDHDDGHDDHDEVEGGEE